MNKFKYERSEKFKLYFAKNLVIIGFCSAAFLFYANLKNGLKIPLFGATLLAVFLTLLISYQSARSKDFQIQFSKFHSSDKEHHDR